MMADKPPQQENRIRLNTSSTLLFGVFLLLIAFVASISFGPVAVSIKHLWQIVSGQENSGNIFLIVSQVRLPRSVAALIVGMALAASGVILQAVMQNPLAAPSLIGVNAGAGLAIMLLLSFVPGRIALLPPATFAGALLALSLIILISSRTPKGKASIILAGVAVSAILGASTDALRLLHPEAMVGATSFMIGGLSAVSWSSIRFALPWLAVALPLALLTGPLLNVISLGDEVAASLGVRIHLARLFLLTLAAVLAGGSVCIVGLLGFVGLIVPHAMRLLLGNDQRFLLPAAMLYGGSLVLLCDLISRMLFAPYEIPVGILLSLIGGPFFIFMLLKSESNES